MQSVSRKSSASPKEPAAAEPKPTEEALLEVGLNASSYVSCRRLQEEQTVNLRNDPYKDLRGTMRRC